MGIVEDGMGEFIESGDSAEVEGGWSELLRSERRSKGECGNKGRLICGII